MKYNPSGGSDSDTGKKRSLRVGGRGRPPARRAAKRRQSDSEDESLPSSEEDSDVSFKIVFVDIGTFSTSTISFRHHRKRREQQLDDVVGQLDVEERKSPKLKKKKRKQIWRVKTVM